MLLLGCVGTCIASLSLESLRREHDYPALNLALVLFWLTCEVSAVIGAGGIVVICCRNHVSAKCKWFGNLMACIIAPPVCFLPFMFGILAMAPNHGAVTEGSRRLHCRNNLLFVRNAIQAYANDNGGCLPCGTYNEIVKQLVNGNYIAPQNSSVSECPTLLFRIKTYRNCDEMEQSGIVSYIYFGTGMNMNSISPHSPLIVEKEGNHLDYGNVLFSDWKVEGFKGEEWHQTNKSLNLEARH